MVSIIMPAYNEEKYIGEAIDSIINQTYQNWELIIVDDCSKDQTAVIVQQYMAKDTRIRLYRFEENQGVCVALNEALKKVQGDYICWLSADDKYKTEMLHSSVEYLKAHPEMQAVFSRHEFINEMSEPENEWEMSESYLSIGEIGCREPYYTLCYIGNGFNACSVLATTEAFKKAGYFDKNHPYAGDYEYMLRLTAYSNIGFLNQLNVESRVHSGQVTNEGKNDIDAIHAYEDALWNDEVRRRLFFKAGIKEGREEIIATLKSRMLMYMRFNCQREVQEVKNVIERFLTEFPQIVKANTWCSRISECIGLQQWEKAEQLFQETSDEIKDFVSKQDWGIVVASLLEHKGDYEKEKEILEIILEVNKNNYEAHYMLGNVYEYQENKLQALEHYSASVIDSKDVVEDNQVLVDNLKRFVNEKF